MLNPVQISPEGSDVMNLYIKIYRSAGKRLSYLPVVAPTRPTPRYSQWAGTIPNLPHQSVLGSCIQENIPPAGAALMCFFRVFRFGVKLSGK